ncbi:MAG TPA: methyltransferase domain-containing protein [Longimicrobium sp.]|nr:methyltransferase domain-containing protein [Longimicrobium sp.]
MTSLPRAAGAERMDEPDQDPAELGRSLVDLQHVNRWLGGYRVVLHHLAAFVARHPRPEYRVLDVATGSADIPLKVAAWARSRGIRMHIVATDNHPTTLEFARRNAAGDASVRVEAADALALPYADDSFDFAICSTALHHFDAREDLLRVLGEMDRVARIAGLINDLRRSRPAYAGARLLAMTFWRRHPVTAHDGPLSVRRAFTRAELAELARAAGLPGARAHRHEPFRVALTWEREG